MFRVRAAVVVVRERRRRVRAVLAVAETDVRATLAALVLLDRVTAVGQVRVIQARDGAAAAAGPVPWEPLALVVVLVGRASVRPLQGRVLVELEAVVVAARAAEMLPPQTAAVQVPVTPRQTEVAAAVAATMLVTAETVLPALLFLRFPCKLIFLLVPE
jgi:hypothetical protein